MVRLVLILSLLVLFSNKSYAQDYHQSIIGEGMQLQLQELNRKQPESNAELKQKIEELRLQLEIAKLEKQIDEIKNPKVNPPNRIVTTRGGKPTTQTNAMLDTVETVRQQYNYNQMIDSINNGAVTPVIVVPF